MFGSEDAMLPLDMSEFKDESSLNRLLGSPSGYVDSEAGGQLTERVRQQPYIIVLFDEVEKAHPRIMDIMLQMIEEGRLTDGRGTPTNFSETVIILTSNLGSENLAVPVITDEVRDEAMDEVREWFRPEFLNRLDEVIMFNALSNDDLYLILKLMLKKENRLAGDRGLELTFSEEGITVDAGAKRRTPVRGAASPAHHPALRARAVGRFPAAGQPPCWALTCMSMPTSAG